VPSNPHYEIAIPAGIPAPAFIPLYAEEVRKKLVSILPAGGYDIRLNRVVKEEYEVTARKGMLAGMKVVVTKKIFGAQDQVTVTVQADSRVQAELEKLSNILLFLLMIPIFILMVAAVHFIYLALLLAALVVWPLKLGCSALIAGFMSLLYRSGNNEFDERRRIGIAAFLGQMPGSSPRPLAAARPMAEKQNAPPGFY
jgi:hypothetical protein